MTWAASVGLLIKKRHVDPSSAYTFSPGSIPAERMDLMRRSTPVVRASS